MSWEREKSVKISLCPDSESAPGPEISLNKVSFLDSEGGMGLHQSPQQWYHLRQPQGDQSQGSSATIS